MSSDIHFDRISLTTLIEIHQNLPLVREKKAFIKPADILSDSINYSNESLTRYGAESGSRLAPAGSLLMVCIGTIGKCNLIERECSFNQQINSLTPVSSVNPRYLLAATRSSFFQETAWKKSSSTTIAILNKGKWLSIPVPIPPFAEQKRIVAKVDELMALCNQLETQQQEREDQASALARASLARFADAPAPANLNFIFHSSFSIHPSDLRKSILTLAVQGKLVRQDPNDEPAVTLLTNIEAEKTSRLRDGTLRNLNSPAPITDDDKEFELPFNWEWVRMGQVVKLWNGFAFKSSDFQERGVPVIRIGDLQCGVVDDTTAVCVSEDAAEKVGPEFWIPEDALLLAMSGATTGKVAFNKTGRRLLLNQRVGTLEPILISPDFVRFFFETIVVRNLSIAFGSAIPNLSAEQINGTVLPLPPLAEQCRIVAKVDQLMILVDALETHLTASRATAANLLDAVVAELTTQS